MANLATVPKDEVPVEISPIAKSIETIKLDVEQADSQGELESLRNRLTAMSALLAAMALASEDDDVGEYCDRLIIEVEQVKVDVEIMRATRAMPRGTYDPTPTEQQAMSKKRSATRTVLEHEGGEAEVRKLVAEGKKEAMSAIRHVARKVAPKEPRAKSRPKVISDLASIVASDQAKTLREDCEHFVGVVDSIEGMDTPGQEQRTLLEKRTKALQKSMDKFTDVLFTAA